MRNVVKNTKVCDLVVTIYYRTEFTVSICAENFIRKTVEVKHLLLSFSNVYKPSVIVLFTLRMSCITEIRVIIQLEVVKTVVIHSKFEVS